MAGTANAGASTASNGGDGGVKEQAQEKAQEFREQAGEQVRKATGQARERARDQVDQRSTQFGEQVNGHASDLRDVAHQLREQGKDGPARIADQVADRAERAGSWMKESDADRILSDVEDFARGNPWAVAAGGLAIGVVASRLLKASSRQRYEQRYGGNAGQLPPTGGTTVASPGVSDPIATRAPGVSDPIATPAPGASDPLAAPTPATPGTPPAPVVDDPLRTPTRGGGL